MAVYTSNGTEKAMISIKEAAAILGVTERRVRVLCAEKRIDGATKISGVWLLPDAPKVSVAGRKRADKIEFEKDK